MFDTYYNTESKTLVYVSVDPLEKWLRLASYIVLPLGSWLVAVAVFATT